MARPPQTAQVIRPSSCWVRVTTVCWQWGHTVWPGTSLRAGVTTTWVTAGGKGRDMRRDTSVPRGDEQTRNQVSCDEDHSV
ncbi:hypothetical protein CRUP_036766 [Coryphaenoides rupestris]|nr:hypothetical protein CRUP_036766 [Coryphaenoides rupestris]